MLQYLELKFERSYLSAKSASSKVFTSPSYATFAFCFFQACLNTKSIHKANKTHYIVIDKHKIRVLYIKMHAKAVPGHKAITKRA